MESHGEVEATDVLQYSYRQFTTNATDHDFILLHKYAVTCFGQPSGHHRAVSIYETKLLIAVLASGVRLGLKCLALCSVYKAS